MSDDIKRIRLEFPRLFAEETVSVQPMTQLSPVLIEWMMTAPLDQNLFTGRQHTPGDGTFCECFGRCYVCHPLTEEERVVRKLERMCCTRCHEIGCDGTGHPDGRPCGACPLCGVDRVECPHLPDGQVCS